MIPAKRRRPPKDRLQAQRRGSGAQWEQQLARELDSIPGWWARRWPASYGGQPFDISAQAAGAALAIECKSIARGSLPYSALRPNEVENLTRFEAAGGISLIAVRRADPPTRVFIPWHAVQERILSGDRGSIPLEDWPQSLAALLEVSQP